MSLSWPQGEKSYPIEALIIEARIIERAVLRGRPADRDRVAEMVQLFGRYTQGLPYNAQESTAARLVSEIYKEEVSNPWALLAARAEVVK